MTQLIVLYCIKQHELECMGIFLKYAQTISLLLLCNYAQSAYNKWKIDHKESS